MSLRPRKSVMGRCDDQVFAYAGLFLLCSLVSALGGGILGMMLFVPSAAAAVVLLSGRR